MNALAAGWRIAFLLAAAPVVGTVLLLAIQALTGARWDGFRAPARLAPTLALAVGAGLVGLATAEPPRHLGIWMAPVAVAARGIAAGLALAWASRRLRRRSEDMGGGATTGAVTLAVYALCVTPIAADWMLGQAPGHAVSAIGMMWTAQGIAAACALALLGGSGSAPTRSDLARLSVAAALGVAYLAFMDYLIVWFGNLPARVGFYLERERPVLVWAALLVGLAAPIALLVAGRQRIAGGAMLAGLFLFDGWWVGGGLPALLVAAAFVALLGGGGGSLLRREAAGG